MGNQRLYDIMKQKDALYLYKGQTCVEKLIPEEQAVGKLIELIKANGDWVD